MTDRPGSNSTEDPGRAGTPPDSYTGPIGGFIGDSYIRLAPDSTGILNYTFFSREWEGGAVDFQLYHKGQVFQPSDSFNATITPSHFIAEPHRAYPANITLKTGPGFTANSALSVVVFLQGNRTPYADDDILVISTRDSMIPGLGILSVDDLRIRNTSLTVRRGETRSITVTYLHGLSGLQNISYSLSASPPLRVNIEPSSFIARYGNPGYTSLLSVTVDPLALPGLYNFSLDIRGQRTLYTSHHNFTVSVPLI